MVEGSYGEGVHDSVVGSRTLTTRLVWSSFHIDHGLPRTLVAIFRGRYLDAPRCIPLDVSLHRVRYG